MPDHKVLANHADPAIRPAVCQQLVGRRPALSGREIEQRYIDVLERANQAVIVPVAVQLSRYFGSGESIALRPDRAGADGLALLKGH